MITPGIPKIPTIAADTQVIVIPIPINPSAKITIPPNYCIYDKFYYEFHW